MRNEFHCGLKLNSSANIFGGIKPVIYDSGAHHIEMRFGNVENGGRFGKVENFYRNARRPNFIGGLLENFDLMIGKSPVVGIGVGEVRK